MLHFPKGSRRRRLRLWPDQLHQQVGKPGLGHRSEITFDTPGQSALDSAGGLYVADSGNHRVLHYSKGSATADVVYGQTNFSNKSQTRAAPP